MHAGAAATCSLTLYFGPTILYQQPTPDLELEEASTPPDACPRHLLGELQ